MKTLLILSTLLACSVVPSLCGCAFLEIPASGLKLSDPIRACSNYIACLLENLCKGDYKIVKRDTSLMGRLKEVAINKETATEVYIRKKRYLVDECCENTCTIETLMHFCQGMNDMLDLMYENT